MAVMKHKTNYIVSILVIRTMKINRQEMLNFKRHVNYHSSSYRVTITRPILALAM